jgi:hypothetical protein
MDKSQLSLDQQIEYYLGKDRLPNLHWKSTIPNAWSIITRPDIQLCNKHMANSVVTLEEGIPYKFNNLGYRSSFDYNIEFLKDQKVILLLGDSDTMGRGVRYHDMYSSKIIKGVDDYYVLNLGIASLSGDGMSRIGAQTMLALQSAVKHVCVLWPILSTREFVSKTFASGIHTVSTHVPYLDWYNHVDWVSNNYNYQKNHILLEQTARAIGAKYHELMINRYDKKSNIEYQTVISPESEYSEEVEFTEFNPDSHTAIANYFLRKINNQPSLFEQLKTQS